MAPLTLKKDYDKLAWSWIEQTNPRDISKHHIESAYRINFPRCVPYSCRRNCKGNPFCLAALGESRWYNEQKHDSSDDYDPDQELRGKDEFIGLKNLGATCYVNSLLQLWFHNLPFRKAILDWDPKEDNEEGSNLTLDAQMLYAPQTTIGHLQLLFALMQNSNKVMVDPTDFVLSLGLDTSYQQDAQEFSKLFLSNFIEDKFTRQSQPHIQNFIKDYFCGEYMYVTKCFACGNENERSEIFYELVVNVCKSLDESLKEFLKEELLEGDDQYYCNVCKKKQNAGRRIRLKYLPKVLNIHLMRFVFDRLTGNRKKLNSFIQFPETLDLSNYLSSTSTPQTNYKLSAVLMHCGSSAHSGHYVANICDSTSGVWYKFNDETVERSEGNRLKLGPEEDVMDGMKKIKPPKAQKSCLTSSNAYMLVYTRVDCDLDTSTLEPPEKWELPTHIKRYLYEKNDEHESYVQNIKLSKDEYRKVSDAKRKEMVETITMLPVVGMETNDNEQIDVISLNSLSNFLQNREHPIDNERLICKHDKLDPDKVTLCKFVSKLGANKLYDQLLGGPRLNLQDTICSECVKIKCEFLRVKKKTSDDTKEIQSMLKMKLDLTKPAYWVGKNSLKIWKSLVTKDVGNTFKSISNSLTNNIVEKLNLCTKQPEIVTMKRRSELTINTSASSPSPEFMNNDCLTPSTPPSPTSTPSSPVERTFDRRHNITLRKRTLDKYVAQSTANATKKMKTFIKGVDGFIKPLNNSIQTDYINKDKINDLDKGKNFSIPDELNSCFVSIEHIEDTLSKLKSKLYHIVDAMNETNSNKQLTNGDLHHNHNDDNGNDGDDEYYDSNVILNSKIQFNPYENQSESTSNNHNVLKNDDVEENYEMRKTNNNVKSYSNVTKLKLIPIDLGKKDNGNDLLRTNEDVDMEDEEESSHNTNADDFHLESAKCDISRDPRQRANHNTNNGDRDSHSSRSNRKRRQRDKDNENEEDDDDESENDELQKEFNEDILCPHGELTADESLRRLVPEGVWTILQMYFPTAKTFPQESEPCLKCLQLNQEDEVTKENHRKMALMHKEKFNDLLTNKNRPSLESLITEVEDSSELDNDLGNSRKLFVVSREFLDAWKRFIKDTAKRSPPLVINNSTLLCVHGRLLYEPDDTSNDENCLFAFVSEEEWNLLKAVFTVDFEISSFYCATVHSFVHLPEICEECVTQRKVNEEQEELKYTRGKLIIRMANCDDSEDSGNKSDEWSLGNKTNKTNTQPSSKQAVTPDEPVGPSNGSNAESTVRRSQRKRKTKTDITIFVSSTDTLMSVKVSILKQLRVAPYDQKLILLETGRLLEDNNATLQELNVHKDSIILLKVDEPPPEEAADFGKTTQQELGFSGTKLLSVDS